MFMAILEIKQYDTRQSFSLRSKRLKVGARSRLSELGLPVVIRVT